MRYGVFTIAATLACAGAIVPAVRARAPVAPRGTGLPPLTAGYPLPPVPETSDRAASYTIDARLDPDAHALDASLVLEWKNTTGAPQSALPFHLYWNAFLNNLSTHLKTDRRRARETPYTPDEQLRRYGYAHVTSVTLLDAAEVDLTPTLRYVQTDDGNLDDRSVMEIRTPNHIAPGTSARLRIAWKARVPYGDVARSGYIHDYYFMAQWFPKIGVFWKGAWNAHQFHPNTEFFADYGNYDVRLTLPDGYVVGATGTLQGDPARNADGTRTFRFVQEDVHDFAWTASRRFVVRTARFDDAGYPPVEIRLLVQPEHVRHAERYLEATKVALRSYGAWSAPYPYGHVTVVDPAWHSDSGGMEYPTLFTGGTSVFAPQEFQSPESVTVHECGHQFWYLLVGTNEFEEAWLDEGFNQYHEEKAMTLAYGPQQWSRRYFGLRVGGRVRGGWPVAAPEVWIGRGEDELSNLRKHGQEDAMARPGWMYETGDAYSLNSYGKPALTLQTLENLVGDETMTRIMRTYARRFRFKHPTTRDFIDTVNQVTGRDYSWFFGETWYSSDLCDYAIGVKNKRGPAPQGFRDDPNGGPPISIPAPALATPEGWDSEVTVERRGGVRMPVEVRVEFGDGTSVNETWDGQYRWTRFKYHGTAAVTRASVDPDGKLAIDVDPSNNTWVAEAPAGRAAARWASRWMLWLQNLLELHLLLS